MSRLRVREFGLLAIGACALLVCCGSSNSRDETETGKLRDVSFDGSFGVVRRVLMPYGALELETDVVKLVNRDQGRYEVLFRLPEEVEYDHFAFCGDRELAYISRDTRGLAMTIRLADAPDSAYELYRVAYSDYPPIGRFALHLGDSLVCMETGAATTLYKVRSDGTLMIRCTFGSSMARAFTPDGSELLIWQEVEALNPGEPSYVLLSYSLQNDGVEELLTANSVRWHLRSAGQNEPVYFTAFSLEHRATNVYKWERDDDSAEMITDIEYPFDIELFNIIGDSIICPIDDYRDSLTAPIVHRAYKK